MNSSYVEPLTQDSADKIAQEWVDGRIKQPAGAYAWSQKRWLMDQLAQLAVAQSVRDREGEDGLCRRLSDAYGIVHRAWDSAAPWFATRVWPHDERPTKEQEKIIDAWRHVVWRRHDPVKAFEEGTTSPDYINFTEASLDSTIAEYLARPWLRHAFLDWVFVDMMITRELCILGEAIKKRLLPGRRDPLGVHHRYFETNGNLREMKKTDWKRLYLWFWWSLAFPIGGILLTFHGGHETTGWWLTAIYATCVIGFIAFKTLRGDEKEHPRVRAFQRWDQMRDVWHRLEGPVINPRLVREAMEKAAEHGVVWPTASWSLIDRVVAIDPAVWIVQPNGN